MTQEFLKIYERDLGRLKQEMEAFKEEENLWKTTGTVKNSAGNLCLHLIGNLNTYIGKTLGNQEYTRDREAEFSSKNIPRTVLLENLSITTTRVNKAIKALKSEDLAKNYPDQVLGYEMTTQFFLIHLAAHLSYHLGQINYLRRILEK